MVWTVISCVLLALLAWWCWRTYLSTQKDHSPRSILITGAAGGICIELCHKLLAESETNTIFATDATAAGVEKLQLIFKGSKRIQSFVLDVTSDDSIAAAVATVSKATGGQLTTLINGAGLLDFGPWQIVQSKRLRQMFDVNFFGTVAVTTAFLPLLMAARTALPKKSNSVRIINITSMSANTNPAFTGPYAASKHAADSFSDSLRKELAPFGILVLKLQPGSVSPPAVATSGVAPAMNMVQTAMLRLDSTLTSASEAKLLAPYLPRLRSMRDGSAKFSHLVDVSVDMVASELVQQVHSRLPTVGVRLFNFTLPPLRRWCGVEQILYSSPERCCDLIESVMY